MGKADFLRLGDWNCQCFQCGRKRKAGDMERNWQGFYVCPEHNEPRQPQDFVRGTKDVQTPPWTQPQPAPIWAPGSPVSPPPPLPGDLPIVGND